MRAWVALTVVLAACVAQPQVLIDYGHTVAAMHDLVDRHITAVEAAATLEEVPPLESDYQDDWRMLRMDLDDEMTMMDGCSMGQGMMGGGGDAMGMMGEADDTLGTMDDHMDSHMVDHPDHTALSDCVDEERTHGDSMSGMLDDMSGYGDEWGGVGMRCH